MLAAPKPLEGIHPVPDWAWAQDRVNFVIVGPRRGGPWHIEGATVRGESARTFSTVRYHLEDDADRRLRVKQNFNDWWIPTVCDISFRAPGTPLIVGDDVAYLGRDYKRHEGVCAHRYGTQVEFSLEFGPMIPEDWAALVAAMEPFVPAAVAEARASSFAARNYWNRWKRVEAPWDTREVSRLRWEPMSSAAFERIAWASTPDQWASMPGAPDAVGVDRHEEGQEAQVVFRSALSLNCTAWLRVLRAPQEPWKPLIDESEINRPQWEEVAIRSRRLRRACMNRDVGNWYYAWRAGDNAYELHLRARKGLDAVKADAAVAGLLA